MHIDSPGRRQPRSLSLALVIGFGLMLSLPAPAQPPEPLSVQGCNTRCQTDQTDCALRCDAEIPCIKDCQKLANSCVDKCQSPAK